MNNLRYWNTFNQPPKTSLKTIEAGRLKGKSDINPQWRYKAMTETFGVVGVGWKFTIDKMWTEQGANNETLVFVNISVYIKDGDKWSDAIPGNGGSTLIAAEKSGMHNSDDAYKMAVTDALSTAMKMLGVAADIYMGLWDGAKYRSPEIVDKKARQELIDRYNKLLTKAEGIGIPTIDFQLTDNMADNEIKELGGSLKSIVDAKEKEGK